MGKSIYLIRHGIVKKYPEIDDLDERGRSFSEKLPILLKEDKIDFIAVVKDKKRCSETIKYLEINNGIEAKAYEKSEFKTQVPMPIIDALKHSISIICYGKTESKMLFKYFDIHPKDTDYTYEVIYKININFDVEEIPTGYSK
ncbi:MAG: hypothetical protein CFE24_06620 [Flavobacterium sp. BFFFF2]|nr:MAG: hypothetical protein CFE24_06620 [Flavobacterium sp. BFFFF2]